MIAEKIAQAKKSKQKKWNSLVAVSCGVVIMVALSLYLLTNFKLSSEQKTAQNKGVQQNKPVLVTQPKVMPNPELSDNELGLQEKTAQNSEADRHDYLAAFQYYQAALKPALTGIDLLRWEQPTSDKLQLSENAALEQFTAGNYTVARDEMNKLTALAKDTVERSQNEADAAIAKLKDAYSILDYNMALLALDKLALHQKGSDQLDSLAIDVENIPKIRDLEQAIHIANIENNPEKELQAIRTLANVDPDWGKYNQRATTLVSQLTTHSFNRAIARGYSAVDKKQVTKARTELNKAKAISASRQEINQLDQAIAQIEHSQKFEKSMTDADSAVALDAWDKARLHLSEALNNKPNDGLLTRRLEKANQIIALKNKMTTLLTSPYRLANETVKVRAKIALIKAEAYAGESASLRVLSTELADTIEIVNKEVAVELVSDGITSVSVRGVGTVGIVASKVIQLKPGPYTFEGKRQGYKSKIVTVTVPINKPSFTLKVVADERI